MSNQHPDPHTRVGPFDPPTSDLAQRLRDLEPWLAKHWSEHPITKAVLPLLREAADALDAAAAWRIDARRQDAERIKELQAERDAYVDVKNDVLGKLWAAEARLAAAERAFVRLAVPTRAFLMDGPSHKYVTPEILNEWEHALADGDAMLAASQGGVMSLVLIDAKERALLYEVLDQTDALMRVMDQHSLAAARAGSYRGDPAVVKQAQRVHNAVETVHNWQARSDKEAIR